MSSLTLIFVAACLFAIAYRFYGLFLARKVMNLRDERETPAVTMTDGHDYVKTNKYVLFGHHFAAIAAAGPLLGPVLAAQFGYLPGALWILIGCVLAGGGARHGRAVRLGAAQGPEPVADRRDRDRQDRRQGGLDRDPVHPDPDPGRTVDRRRQRHVQQPLGHVHRFRHHPDRDAHGRLHAQGPPGRHQGRQPHRRRPPGRCRSSSARTSRPIRRWRTCSPSPRRSSRSSSRSTASSPRCCRSGCCSARATTCPPI